MCQIFQKSGYFLRNFAFMKSKGHAELARFEIAK